MINRVLIPQLFENMEEATIGVWCKQEGDAVRRGDALCDLITEKTTVQLEAEVGGVLRLITAAEKSVVAVGGVIAVIAGESDDLAGLAAEITTHNATLLTRPAPSSSAASGALELPKQVAPATVASRIRATPAARRVARELSIDIETVAARLPGKVLSEDDIRSAAKTDS